MKEPGLDDRYQTKRGPIERKHRNTELGTLRETYPRLLPERRADIHLGTLMHEYGVDSLNGLLRALNRK
jgi:hypothetical protein